MSMLEFVWSWVVIEYNRRIGPNFAKQAVIMSELSSLPNPYPLKWTDAEWRQGCEVIRDVLGSLSFHVAPADCLSLTFALKTVGIVIDRSQAWGKES